LCYIGQGHTVNVPLPPHEPRPEKTRIRELFEEVYEANYGRVYSDMQAEGSRAAYSMSMNEYVPHAVYDRYGLRSGTELKGPAIIEERESTTIVDRGGRVRVDDRGILVIEVEA
jgi:N-methylhydantoinase A/oxoprolinase/acetone carboxylase beta subunit